ncbi:MAG: hypothetical protein BWZ02_02183 [Lentisphaerae bacterium ADurb.BinA184]|nr:MAG: hypothetical protein BWZ02_02183 [Lentisphaerae bacterium ADurb.BinA184]
MSLSIRPLHAAAPHRTASVRRVGFAALTLVACLLVAGAAQAIDYVAGSPYVQDFDTLGSSQGTTLPWTNDATLAGWYAKHGGGTTYTDFTSYLVNNGSQVTHILQSQGSIGSTDRALGCMSYNDTTLWGLKLTNITAATIPEFTLTYTGEQWRDQSTQPVYFTYSVGATSLDGAGFTSVAALDFLPPENSPPPYELDGNDPANRIAYSASVPITGGWAPGADLWLRWGTGWGQGSGVSIDDLTFTTPAPPAIPEPASVCLLALAALSLARGRGTRR